MDYETAIHMARKDLNQARARLLGAKPANRRERAVVNVYEREIGTLTQKLSEDLSASKEGQ